MADKRIDQLTQILASALAKGTMWLAIGRDGASAQKLDAAVLVNQLWTSQQNLTTAGPHAVATNGRLYTNIGATVEMDITLWSPAVDDWCVIHRAPSADYAIRVEPQATHYIHDAGQGKYVELLESGFYVFRCMELTRWTLVPGGEFDYEP